MTSTWLRDEPIAVPRIQLEFLNRGCNRFSRVGGFHDSNLSSPSIENYQQALQVLTRTYTAGAVRLLERSSETMLARRVSEPATYSVNPGRVNEALRVGWDCSSRCLMDIGGCVAAHLAPNEPPEMHGGTVLAEPFDVIDRK